MPAWILQLIEAIAAGIGRGIIRGALEEIERPRTATEEVPNDADLARRRVFADAVAAELRRLQSVRAAGSGPTQSIDTTPTGGTL